MSKVPENFDYMALWHRWVAVRDDGTWDDRVEGLGLGAAPFIRRQAAMGLFIEENPQFGFAALAWMGSAKHILETKKVRGRPLKEEWSSDQIRAYLAWQLVNEKALKDLTQPEIIAACAQEFEPKFGQIFDGLFSNIRGDRYYEQALSRGKRDLEIDSNWKSEKCEGLMQSFEDLIYAKFYKKFVG
jgi:hypothetical protein